MNRYWIALCAAFLGCGGLLPVCAGTLVTREGGVFTGLLGVDPTGQITLQPASSGGIAAGMPLVFAPADVKLATFREAPTGVLSGGTLPGGWIVRDIGLPGIGGSADYDRGTFTLRGAGQGLVDRADTCQIVCRRLPADGQIIARLGEFRATDPEAIAGVMIRATSPGNSRFVALVVTPGKGVRCINRAKLDEPATTDSPAGFKAVKAPCWLKLLKVGNVVITSVSMDRKQWQVVSRVPVESMPEAQVGMVVASHRRYVPAEADFDAVQLSAHGLRADYFSDLELKQPKFSRFEPNVMFRPGFNDETSNLGDTYSIRWTGQLESPSTENFAFRLQTNGAARLWLNGRVILDTRNRRHPGTVALQAGLRYELMVDYVAGAGEPQCDLYWAATATHGPAIVPMESYYLPTDAAPLPPGINAGLDASVSTPARGIFLTDGSFLPGELVSVDEKTAVFKWKDETELRIPVEAVARVLFRSIPPAANARLRAHGVLTRDGDFVDGDPQGMSGASLKLNSVVFGVMAMNTESDVVAVVYRDFIPAADSGVIVRTIGGSSVRGRSAKLNPSTRMIVIDQPLAGPMQVSPAELISIEASLGR